ncbi:MAG: methylated-DNA--[protein]-cysteine S-methyltransferase [Bacteroidota bacterium]
MIEKAYCPSPFGYFLIEGSEHGIRRVNLSDKKRVPNTEVPGVLKDCVDQLSAYFARERQEFDLKLDWAGHPEFNQAVWAELIQIPYGHTTSYSQIANRLNNPKSVRAVGQANRNNPIAIIVPCHRVIAKSGDLQGYFYGLDMKRKLLELENPMSFASQGSLF